MNRVRLEQEWFRSMKISVVVTTFNGEKYIYEQLDSIASQSRKPDEVLIFDDHSGDATAKIIREFIHDRELSESWHMTIQKENVGWKRNFYDGIKASRGDILFFSDQDDIWKEDKIEVMARAMEESHAGCIYGEYELMDGLGNVIPGAEKRIPVAMVGSRRHFNTIVTMGCRMCISREVADLYLHLHFPAFAYDTQCGRLSYLYSSMAAIPRVVLQYRIHGENHSGIQKSMEEGSLTLADRIREIEVNIEWLRRLLRFDEEEKGGKNVQLLKEVLEFQGSRLLYLKGERSLWNSGIDKQFYRDRGMLMGDIAYRHGINRGMGLLRSLLIGVKQCRH